MTSLQSHLQLATTVLVRITLANNLKHLVPSEIYCFKTIVKNLVQVCQVSQISQSWGFIFWNLVFLTECSVEVMWGFFNYYFILYACICTISYSGSKVNSQRVFEPNQIQRGPEQASCESSFSTWQEWGQQEHDRASPQDPRSHHSNQTMQNYLLLFCHRL